MALRTRATNPASSTSLPRRMRSFLISVRSIRRVPRRSFSPAFMAAFTSASMRCCGVVVSWRGIIGEACAGPRDTSVISERPYHLRAPDGTRHAAAAGDPLRDREGRPALEPAGGAGPGADALSPGLGIATVYRTLKSGVEGGWLQPVDLPGEPPRYEPTGKQHHHHFHCRSCDRVYEIEGCPDGLRNLTPPGFALEAHEIVLYGRCADCAR